MCGRFYVDDATAREILKAIRKVDEELCRERDIHPMERALVIQADKSGQNTDGRAISKEQRRFAAAVKRWGFPGFDGERKEGRSAGKVLINARAETVLERSLFRESVMRRRIVIPAAGFYEWNRNKEMATFTRQGKILYLAGFYNRFEEEDRFVILTTAANASMKEVHDRMPLILEAQEVLDWLWEDSKLELLLRKEPPQLQKIMPYEQTTLKFG